MTRRSRPIALAATLVALAGCAARRDVPPPAAPFLLYHKTGGFVGLRLGLSVDTQGHWVAFRLGTTEVLREGGFAPATLDTLRTRVAQDRDWGTFRAREADAFHVRLEHFRDGGSRVVEGPCVGRDAGVPESWNVCWAILDRPLVGLR